MGYIDYEGSWNELLNLLGKNKEMSDYISIEKLLDKMEEIISDNKHLM